jgi:hypothetical protein
VQALLLQGSEHCQCWTSFYKPSSASESSLLSAVGIHLSSVLHFLFAQSSHQSHSLMIICNKVVIMTYESPEQLSFK